MKLINFVFMPIYSFQKMGISTSISISCLLALCQFSSVSSSCAVVKCALPLCKPGEIQRTKPRECCSSCVPVRCAAVLCQPTVCMGSERTYTPPGECCPVCERGDLGTNRGKTLTMKLQSASLFCFIANNRLVP